MGERDWMHETPSASGSRVEGLTRRFATTQWLSGKKFVSVVVAVVVIGVLALVLAGR